MLALSTKEGSSKQQKNRVMHKHRKLDWQHDGTHMIKSDTNWKEKLLQSKVTRAKKCSQIEMSL